MGSPQYEAAWAAGLFDGEGSTYNVKQSGGRHALVASITQNHPEVLYRFQRIVGIGCVYGPVGPYGNQSKPSWEWRTRGLANVQAALAPIWAWLSFEKRLQARRAGLFWVSERTRFPKVSELRRADECPAS